MNVEIYNRKKSFDDTSELRQDLLTGEWVVIAKKRAKRPDQFRETEEKPHYDPHDDPFLDPETSGQEEDVLIYRKEDGEWTTRVFPNKFPAVVPANDIADLSEGPHIAMSGYGFHELVVTHDGDRSFAFLAVGELAEVLDAYADRYRTLMRTRSIRSVNIFHNHGKRAGASVIHPHSQIIALPVVSPSVAREISYTERFYRQNRVSVFEVILAHEAEHMRRIVYDNEHFFVYCPFASERAFQMRIIPKKPSAYFERITDRQKITLADALQKALRALYDGLNNPDYNFYVRTAPCDGRSYPHYSWHIDIFPRTHVYAGFEYATDIEIVPMAPEDAAAFLHKQITTP